MFRSVPTIRDQVVIPVLQHLADAGPRYHGLASTAAVQLMLGTAAAESEWSALRQVGGGPALSLWQVEPATHDDVLARVRARHAPLADRLSTLLLPAFPSGTAQLATNLHYACAVARLVYYLVPSALPPAGDLVGQAAYWKQHFNTPAGAGTVARYLDTARRLAVPHFPIG